MPEDNTKTPTPSIPPVDPKVVSDAPAEPATPAEPTEPTASSTPAPTPAEPAASSTNDQADDLVSNLADAPLDSPTPAIYTDIATKIEESQNVLIALSSDPSVDEMAAAIGLSLYLDKLGKRATAIYSGSTPNALEFLKPEETFEPTVDTLQDFVIALNKEKADHLRYKLDGEYVKIYITPYKTRIGEEDLDFSYGDFNVDLVFALDVANGIDLDSALREHGRIMHDAIIINVTTGNPGKFGEIEWSDKSASSVSEMLAKFLYLAGDQSKIDKEEATAFLTGIVAATNRFSNAATTPETMQISSKLMKSGANQQLVSKNITPDTENELFGSEESASALKAEAKTEAEPKSDSKIEAAPEPELKSTAESTAKAQPEPKDPTNLSIRHGEAEPEVSKESEAPKESEESKPADAPALSEPAGKQEPAEPVAEPAEPSEPAESAKPTESTESAESTESTQAPDNGLLDDLKAAEESLSHAGAETTPESKQASLQIDSKNESSNLDEITNPEKVLSPSEDFDASEEALEEEGKYGKMLENALEEAAAIESAAPVTPATPAPAVGGNPAAASAPTVPTNPEINGVPEMNYMPLPDQEILPPPPTPPIDMANMAPGAMPEMPPAVPTPESLPAVEPTPAPTPQAATEPAPEPAPAAPTADPSAFKIPGM